jgi:hypothetical protein
MSHDKSSRVQVRRSSGRSIWPFIGGAALVLIAVGVITQFHDIKRYVKMSMM